MVVKMLLDPDVIVQPHSSKNKKNDDLQRHARDDEPVAAVDEVGLVASG